MEIASIDHFVLTVRSITETCAFYERVLGMKAAEFGQGRWSDDNLVEISEYQEAR